MNIGLNYTIYTDEEIIDLAKKMYNEYEFIFENKQIPTSSIMNLAKIITEYPYKDEKRLMSLEYAARIKYEIIKYIDFVNNYVSKDPKYFDYKSDIFAAKKAVCDIYGISDEKTDNTPKLINYCLGNAISTIFSEYTEDAKTLALNNK